MASTEPVIQSNQIIFTTDSSELAAQPVYTTPFLEDTAQIGQVTAGDSVNAVTYQFHPRMLGLEEKLHRAVAFPAAKAVLNLLFLPRIVLLTPK
jgi:hypothetical protein